ncbi:MAG: alpha/beta hydrolase [Deltaproteobacteria bacterium]|nr:alpha/beta hydrolase [Deltaproteobacteria bacterium]
MPNTVVNSIRIEYETFGDPSSPPLLLIIGLAGQLIFWDEEICRKLAESGYFVIRFDNRDSGLSQKLEDADVPDIMEAVTARMMGEDINAPYSIEDMAKDAAGLLDGLGIEKAHVCGMSMGGMIAQSMAIQYPERILSLTSIYSTTGNPELPPPSPAIMQVVLAPPPKGRELCIEQSVNILRTISGSGFEFDEAYHRNIAAQAYDRAFYPPGVSRQLMAILAQENRKPALGSLSVPALVIHGDEDPLVPVEGGKDTAAAVPGAKLIIIEGMGHDLPHGGAWPRIVDAIIEHTHDT